jgi:NADPH:quinone reductase-like Zn-dependent oxidoreductase
MKAFVVETFGKRGLRAADVPDPTIAPRDVLVRVLAASINPLDRMVRNGEFKFLLKYKTPFVLGHDGAGVVPRVGADVQDYQVGDEAYARPRDLRIGTFAEYIAIDHADIAPKLISLTMEESAAVPLGRYPRGRRSPIWRGSRPLLKPAMALMSRKVRAQARKLGVRYSFFFMRAAGDQLKTLAAFYDQRALRAVLDRTFTFDETLDAMAYGEQGRAKGKVVITMPLPST